MVNYPSMHAPTLHYTRSASPPSTPLQKAADRLNIDPADPLRQNPAAVPTPHPSSPAANPPIFSNPKIAQALLVDYVAGLTASRLCANYNISLQQLFAWRRAPETQAILSEHEEFAAAQTRQVQHDKEPEIILTLCAIATRGSDESESRRAASDLLRTFKFRDYLAQRATPISRPRILAAQSDTQSRGISSVPSNPSPLLNPHANNTPPTNHNSTNPRPPRPYTPPHPIPSLPRRSPSTESDAACSCCGFRPSASLAAITPTHTNRDTISREGGNAFQPNRADRFEPRVEQVFERHPRSACVQSPHAESVQLHPPILSAAKSPDADSALDRRAHIGALDHLAADHDMQEDAHDTQIKARATDLVSTDEEDQPTEEDLIEDELLEEEAEEDDSEVDDSEEDDLDDDESNELDDDNNEQDDDENDEEDDTEPEDDNPDENPDETPDGETGNDSQPITSNAQNPSDPYVPSVPFPSSRSALRAQSRAFSLKSEILSSAISHSTSHIETEILTLPTLVPAFSPAPADPAPGFPLCLTPKPSALRPTFEELRLFMPPPSTSFNPFWPESDIFYLCYPGRSDKSNLRSALVSHQEILARAGAQALVDRHHFTADQQSHEAYSAAVDFYQQLARKHPPPDH